MRVADNRRVVYFVYDRKGKCVHKTNSHLQASYAATGGLRVVTSKNKKYVEQKYG